MKRFILSFIFLLFTSISFSQFELGYDIIEPDIPDPDVEEQPGGLYMPSIAENG